MGRRKIEELSHLSAYSAEYKRKYMKVYMTERRKDLPDRIAIEAVWRMSEPEPVTILPKTQLIAVLKELDTQGMTAEWERLHQQWKKQKS